MTDDPEITDPRDPHKRPDIVAELDRYLRSDKTFAAAFVDSPSWAALVPPIQRLAEMVQRARDEIVALREQLEAVKGIAGNERRLSEAIAQQAHDEALEEAAEVLEEKGLSATAEAIRALKDKGNG